MMITNVIKVMLPAVLAFFIGILITPLFSKYFYKFKMWKKSSRSTDNVDQMIPEFKKIHNEEGELHTPRIGGIIIWASVLLCIFTVFLISIFFPSALTEKLNFLSRNQSILPLFALLAGSVIGLVDDLLQIYSGGKYARDDMVGKYAKLTILIGLGLLMGWWFYVKLGVTGVHIPFDGDFYLGIFFIPFFIIVPLGCFSSSIIDGVDGLSGGVLSTVFAAYTIIAFTSQQYDLAALCAVITGSIMAFLWFNIPPARFYMGETGIMGLTLALSTVAFMTNSVLVLPIIAMPLVITSLSNIIQMISKKVWKKRVFRIAPLHHHLEAIGWSRPKITMRYWIFSLMFAIFGTIIKIIS